MSRSACEVCGETYDYCGQCGTCHKCMGEDIDRLKAELEVSNMQRDSWKSSSTRWCEKVDALELQLAEARSEVERFKHMAQQNSTEMCEWMEKANKARQEAARGCYEIARTVLVLAMKRDNFIGNAMDDLLDEINQRFGLEGVRDESTNFD